MSLVLLVVVAMPIGVFAQRRLIVARTRRSHIVVYRRPVYSYRTFTYGYPQSYYRTYYSNGYGYPQSYYSTYYSNGYGYTDPYYATPYYAYRYSQPYISNGYASPAYYYQSYRPRRHNHFRVGIWLR